jgi:hypothetical protein
MTAATVNRHLPGIPAHAKSCSFLLLQRVLVVAAAAAGASAPASLQQ